MAAVSTRYLGLIATGAKPGAPAPGQPFSRYGLQVKGVGASATSWSVLLEGSVDNTNWSTLATHNAVDGSTVWATQKPSVWIRPNVTALSLGSATAINVYVVAS